MSTIHQPPGPESETTVAELFRSLTLDLNDTGADPVFVKMYARNSVRAQLTDATGTWATAEVEWVYSLNATDWELLPDATDITAEDIYGPYPAETIGYVGLRNKTAEGSASTVTVQFYASTHGRLSHPYIRTDQATDQTITAGGSLLVTHGLGVAPNLYTLALVCQSTDAGWAAGNVVMIDQASKSNDKGLAFHTLTSTSWGVRFAANAATFELPHKTTGTVTALTNANWKLRVTVYAVP